MKVVATIKYDEVVEKEINIVEIEGCIPSPEKWVWMPHAAHFVASCSCRFRMATAVNDFIISTVGEYHPRGSEKKEEIGCDRFYETMVFLAKESEGECPCCEKVIGEEVEMNSYNDSKSAFNGHMEMCNKYSKIRAVKNG